MSDLLSYIVAQRKVEGFDLSSQLRVAIKLSGERAARISEGTGIAPSSLSRFMSGRLTLSSRAVDRLSRYLGLYVVSAREWNKRDRVFRMYEAGQLQSAQPDRA
jgi:hypothetical protein